jgi:hypothetical protein
MQSAIRSAGLILALSCLSVSARAQTTDCIEITAVPFTITAPGAYCLKTSLSTANPSGAILVQADDVVIDLNDRILDGTAAGLTSRALGIQSDSRNRLTVRNGTIRGFYRGLQITGGAQSEGHVVEKVVFDRINTLAVWVEGKGSIVRNNVVRSTKGSDSTGTRGMQIYLADFAQVVDNEVLDTVERAIGTAIGINVTDSLGVAIERNVISNAAFGPGTSYGIVVGGGGRTIVADNHIANMRQGIHIERTGLYMGNTVGGAITPFFGGTAAGATNFSF